MHGGLVRALRRDGHDVTAITEQQPGSNDPSVARTAFANNRIILTQDGDFGRLVFVDRLPVHGVVFMRYPPPLRLVLIREVTALIAREGERLVGNFVVVTPGRHRSTPL